MDEVSTSINRITRKDVMQAGLTLAASLLVFFISDGHKQSQELQDTVSAKADKTYVEMYVDKRFYEHEGYEDEMFNSIKELLKQQTENQSKMLEQQNRFVESIDRRLSNLEKK